MPTWDTSHCCPLILPLEQLQEVQVPEIFIAQVVWASQACIIASKLLKGAERLDGCYSIDSYQAADGDILNVAQVMKPFMLQSASSGNAFIDYQAEGRDQEQVLSNNHAAKSALADKFQQNILKQRQAYS